MDSAWRIRMGMLFIAAAALSWAAMEGIAEIVLDGYSPIQVVWMRYATHLLILVVIFAPRRGTAMVRATRPRLQIVRGLLMFVMPFSFVGALLLADLAQVLAVFWIVPLLTMVFSVLILGERVEGWRWLVASAGWLGALLILRPGADILGPGIMPAFIMAVCLSVYLVFTRQLQVESTLTNLVYTAASVLVPLSLITPLVWMMPGPRALAMMICIGILGLSGLYAFDRAVDYGPVSSVAPLLYTQPVWAFAIALLAGKEHLGKSSLLGIAIIGTVCCVFLVTAGWRRMEARFGTGAASVPAGLAVPGDPASAQRGRVRP